MTRRQSETRVATVLEVRTTDDGQHQAELRVCNYGPVDTYGTSWRPGVFTRSIAENQSVLPAVWCHDETRPIGVITDFRDSGTSLDGTLTFLPFDEVPDARMAYAAMKAGSHRGVSFRFERKADQPDPNNRGATLITDADIHEGSVVLVGSVPGTGVLSVRSETRRASADVLVRVPARVEGTEYRDTITAAAAEPVDGSMTGQDSLAAADTALDSLVVLLADRTDVPDDVVALVLAADAFIDAAMDDMGVDDVEDEPTALVEALRSRPAFTIRTVPVQPDPEEADVFARLDRLSGTRAPVGSDYSGPYADPKNKKYPIDESHVQAAWSYINQADSASKYPLNGVTLSEVKDRIKAAMKKFGHDVKDGS